MPANHTCCLSHSVTQVIAITEISDPAATVTVTLQRGDTVVVIRDVPAAVCQNCGEYYLDEAVASKLYRQGKEAVQRRAEVEILRYAA